jgi:ParB family chromosome partitioning protein
VGRGRVVETLTEALAALKAEAAENTCRKDLSPTEAVAIGTELEKLEGPKAKERQATSTGGNERKPKPGSGKLPEAGKGRTRDKVAAAVGMSGRTYEKAKAVVEAAEHFR